MSEYCFIIVKLNNNLSTNNLHYKHQPTINIIQNNLLGSTEGTSIHFICQRWSDDFYCIKSESGFFLRRPALVMKISHLRYLVLIEKSGSNFLIWLQTDLDATNVRYLTVCSVSYTNLWQALNSLCVQEKQALTIIKTLSQHIE